jgi:hypothetical protein
MYNFGSWDSATLSTEGISAFQHHCSYHLEGDCERKEEVDRYTYFGLRGGVWGTVSNGSGFEPWSFQISSANRHS